MYVYKNNTYYDEFFFVTMKDEVDEYVYLYTVLHSWCKFNRILLAFS